MHQNEKPTGVMKSSATKQKKYSDKELNYLQNYNPARISESLGALLKTVSDEQANESITQFQDLDPAVLAGLRKETGAVEEAEIRRILNIGTSDSLAGALQGIWSQRGRDTQASDGHTQLSKGRETQIKDNYKGRKEGAWRKKTKEARAAKADGTDLKPFEVIRICKRCRLPATTDHAPLFHPVSNAYLFVESSSKTDRLCACQQQLSSLIPDPSVHPGMEISPRKKF